MRLRSAETLRALMRQQGLSLSGLARAARCSKSFISHLLSGRRSSCSDDLAGRIAGALEVPVHVVFVPSQSATGRQVDRRSLPSAALGVTRTPSRARTSDTERRARPGITSRKAGCAPRSGWEPRRACRGTGEGRRWSGPVAHSTAAPRAVSLVDTMLRHRSEG